ncbi:MAG TPA: hypothetical protein VGZ28_01200 [Terriglobales bacterium]|jgi:hypothetical protein|nr:hypothetical protein [Terriglobales bacterium]
MNLVSRSKDQIEAAGSHAQEVIRSAERELNQLLKLRAELMKRIGTIRQTLAGLANLFGDSVLSDDILSVLARKSSSRQPGFTSACRRVVMEAKNPVGARTVCQMLEQRFPEVLVRHKDPIASVTTVLNRLADYGEVRCLLNENGRRVYEWIAERENHADLLVGDNCKFTPQP